MDDQVIELINSYVDGSIDQAGMRQLKDILAADAGLARDVEFLVRQRKLCLGDKVALPYDLSAAVFRKLERRPVHAHKFGARRFFNVAAIAAMVLVLGSVLLVIIGPFASGKGGGVRSVTANISERLAKRMSLSDAPAYDLPVAVTALAATPEQPESGLCHYYLTFSTEDIAKTERVLGQLFYEYNLLSGVNVTRQPGKTFYNVECSRKDFCDLAKNISPLWSNADSVSLEFADYTTRSRINIAGITERQFEKIATDADTSNKIKNAAVASVMNSLPSVPLNSFEKGYDVPATLFTLRPVLAGSKNAGNKGDRDGNYVTLSIKIQNPN